MLVGGQLVLAGLVLVGLVVGDEELAVAAVAAGLAAGDADDVEEALGAVHLVEDGVHLLEGAVRRLRVEEVHARHDEGVDHGEDDVCLVSDVVEGDGGDDCWGKEWVVSFMYSIKNPQIL